MKRYSIVALAAGALFGLGLAMSGMTPGGRQLAATMTSVIDKMV